MSVDGVNGLAKLIFYRGISCLKSFEKKNFDSDANKTTSLNQAVFYLFQVLKPISTSTVSVNFTLSLTQMQTKLGKLFDLTADLLAVFCVVN